MAPFQPRKRSDPSHTERRDRRSAIEDVNVVMEAAAAFLAVRPRSVSETRRRLEQHGYRTELVEEVITRFVEMGYLDDADFARAWVESRDRSRPRGTTALRRELSLKGVDRETVRAALDERETVGGETADRTAAMDLMARRGAGLMRIADPLKRRQKAYALLARTGFDPEICRSVSATVLTAESLDGEALDDESS